MNSSTSLVRVEAKLHKEHVAKAAAVGTEADENHLQWQRAFEAHRASPSCFGSVLAKRHSVSSPKPPPDLLISPVGGVSESKTPCARESPFSGQQKLSEHADPLSWRDGLSGVFLEELEDLRHALCDHGSVIGARQLVIFEVFHLEIGCGFGPAPADVDRNHGIRIAVGKK